jgi:hypothetical protein
MRNTFLFRQDSQQPAETIRRTGQGAGRGLDGAVAGLQDGAAGFGHGGQQGVVLGCPQLP